jgi:Ca2+-binding RTX toxin-like protein
MEGNTAYWAPFSTLSAAFPVIGSELISTAALLVDTATMKFAQYQITADGALAISLGWGLGGTAYVKNYSVDFNSGVGTAGITVFQAGGAGGKQIAGQRINSYVNLALYAGFGHGLEGYDPLVLDLNGDGYNLVAEDASSTYFEFDSDGFGEHAGWVRGTDGFLVRDANANGKIDNVTEMFGNETTGGFDMLAGYDANLDGVIDASDGVFSSLSVWQDYDQDGVTDTGELKSLSELGVVSINLTHNAPASPTVIGGNTISQVGSFTRADGSTGGIADVLLGLNETNSRWLGDNSISTAAAALPQLTGFGEIKDMRVAMTGDAVLIGLVQDYVELQTTDLSALEAGAEDILYRWAGVDGVTAQSLGSDGFDTRKLAFLEKYTGYELMVRNASGEIVLDNLDEVESLWQDQLTRLTLRLAVQGPLASDFSGIAYNAERDLLVASTPAALGDLLHGLLTDLPSDPTAAATQWANWAPLLGALTESMVRFDANVVRADYVFAQLVAAMDGVSQPLSLQQLSSALGIGNVQIGTVSNETIARAASGTAIFYSGGGNDVLNGGSGQDVYVFGRQIGHTTINDVEAREAGDRIRFAFLNRSDVSFARSGADLLITVTATGETVTVTGQFADVTPGGADLILSSNKGVEDIQFADGSVMEMPAIMIAVGTGTDGNDHLIGTMHSDALTGGKGNDLLQGGDDADLYVINAGDGQDVIQDSQTTPLLRAADMLVFGDDIAPDDLVISRSGASGADLLFTIGSSGQSVLIQNQFGYTSLGYNAALSINSRIEAFAFREYGDSWSYKDIQQKLIAQTTTSGADVTRGFGDDDTFQASAGNDVLIGMDGADTYNWGKGSGNDTIDEQALYIDVEVGLGGISLTTRADTVQFSSGVTLADLAFTRDSSAPDLTIMILSTGEKLTVKNQFAGIQTGVLGAQWFNRVEWFQLADGSRISWQDVEALVTTGGDGNDTLYGDILSDHMIGGKGNDTLSGGGGGDIYVFNAGDGHDTLSDGDTSFLGEGFLTVDGSPDILQLGAGITPADVAFGRNGKDVDLIIGSSGDRVTLKGQDEYIYTGVFGNLSSYRIEEIHFADGTIWTWQDLNQRMIAAATTAGNDVTVGTSTDDVFAASAGDDILDGADGSDTYAFGRGSGHDIIRDRVDNILDGSADKLVFGSGIALTDVAFSRNGDDLIITINDTGDSVKIEQQFRYDAWFTWHQIETFQFADGTTLSNSDVQAILLNSTSGNDTLTGFGSDDLLDGGAGDDTLIGADGSDTYKFGLGSGHDTIQEWVSNTNLGSNDTVSFGVGVAPGDLTFSRNGNDLIIGISGSSDSLTIAGQFNQQAWFNWNAVENFTFADGTVWTKEEVAAKLLAGTAGDDVMIGTSGNDRLDGGAGSDMLKGGDGSDTYVFGRDYGHDEIQESVGYILNGEDDRVVFKPGITMSDLAFARSGNDLLISIAGTDDQLKITGEFAYSAWFTWNDIERFELSDGTVFTKEDVQVKLLQSTSGDDTLVGFGSDDVLDGGAGNDTLIGADGSDTYRFGHGYGHDTIQEWVGNTNLASWDTVAFSSDVSPDDLLVRRQGNDLVVKLKNSDDSLVVQGHFNLAAWFTWNAVEAFTFADGTTWSPEAIVAHSLLPTDGDDDILATQGADSLSGGKGNDIIRGWSGDDSYHYAPGDGNDLYTDDGGNDVVYLDGILSPSVTVTRSATDPSDMVLTFANGQTLTIDNQFDGGPSWGIETFIFGDQTQISAADLQVRYFAGLTTSGNDTITGTWRADIISGGDGNDVIDAGDGNDILTGGAGNDTIRAGNGADDLTGGTGADRLEGAGGDDVYRFNVGDGQDTIYDNNEGWSYGNWTLFDGGNDRLELGVGINPADIDVVEQGADNLLLTVRGTGDQILLQGVVSATERRLETIHFADGTTWSHADLMQRALVATSGDDIFYAGTLPMTLSGGAGNDTLTGSNGIDTISGDAGNDLIDARDGDDVVSGGAGDDTLKAGGGADDISGGAGTDRLEGAGGNDVYRYNLGDGQDTIYDSNEGWSYGSWTLFDGGNDRLELGAGITPADIAVVQQGANDVLLKFRNAGDQLLLQGVVSSTERRIETIHFADGTTWSHADLMQRALASTPGDDVLYAGTSASIMSGGDGNDTLNGSEYNDVLYGDAGNDTLLGNGGADILAGGTGTDRLEGAAGDDVYRFGLGDGQDTVLDENWGWWYGDRMLFDGGNDRLELAASINPADIDVVEQGADNLLLKIRGTADQILLQGVVSATQRRIETVSFADGTVWTHADLMQRALTPTTGDDVFYAGTLPMTLSGGDGNDTLTGSDGVDTISGDAGNDTIDAREGNDILAGGAGNDTLKGGGGADDLSGGLGIDRLEGAGGDDVYRFNLGDGQDTIYDNNEGWSYGNWTLFDGGNDRLELGAGINPADIDVVEQGADNLLIKVRGTNDQILLQGVVSATQRRLESVRFADGTIWTHADLMQRALTPTAGDDVFYAGTLSMTISGGDGNDTLTGSDGNDTISGDAGNDIIDAQAGNNVLSGGAGNDIVKAGNGADDISGGSGTDRLEGAGGDDVYHFNLGDGQDTIYDSNEYYWLGDFYLAEGGNDRLELGAGINPNDIDVIQRTDGNLLLQVRGTTDQIMLQGVVPAAQRRIETVRFADGTTWTHADMMARAVLDPTIRGTANNDSITLASDYVVVDAGAGNDTLTVSANGGGRILFGAGSGSDVLNNPGSGYTRTDQLDLQGLNPADVSLQRVGDQLKVKIVATGETFTASSQFANGGQVQGLGSLKFADGTVWDRLRIQQEAWFRGTAAGETMYGTTGADTFLGDGGNDYLVGGAGDDTYVYRSGDGSDVIYDYNAGATDLDVLKFADLNPDDLIFRRSGDHLYIKDKTTGQEIQGQYQFHASNQDMVESIRFADGTIWDAARIRQEAWLRGTAGGETIYGTTGADTFLGDGGNDYLVGDAGDDTYVYRSGDGSDVIYDYNAGVTDLDVLKFTDLNPDDLIFRRSGDHLYIKDKTTGQEIQGLYQFHASNQDMVESIRFADGTIWDAARIQQEAWLRGGAAGESIGGTAGADTFQGNGGDDYLVGGAGDDTYVYRSGDGNDHIWDYNAGTPDTDTLKLVDLNPANVQLHRSGDHLYVKDLTTGQEIWVEYHFYSDGRDVLERIQFADGTIWTKDYIAQLLSPPPAIAGDAVTSGSVTEQTATTGSTSSDSVAGALRFTDGATGVTHSVTVNSVNASGIVSGLPSNATLLPLLSFGAVTEPNGTAEGVSTWTFSGQDSLFDYLAAGQTTQLVFAVTLSNSAGKSVSQNITVTVTGTNDLPLVAAGTSATGSLTELAATAGSSANDTASGSLRFTDGDTPNTHSASVLSVTASGTTSGLPTNATMLNWLAKGTLVEQVGSTAGSLPWSFAAPDSSFDYLGAGQVATLTYAVQIADNIGGTVTQNVVITATGTNDTPLIGAGTTATGAVTELANTSGSTANDVASGTLRFTDLDLADTHGASVLSVAASGTTSGLPANATLLAMLGLGSVTEQAGATAGSLPWTFTAQDKTFDYLGAGQTATLNYVVQLSDGNGGTVSQNVTVTITGTNDTPLVSAGTITGAITELASVTGSSTNDTASGTLKFTDADPTDTHSATILSVAASGTTSGLPANATMLGWLSKGALVEQAGATPGSLPWSFAAPDSVFDYLGAGETATLSYVVRITDSQGANLDQSVVVTVTGSNDAPTAQAKSGFTTDNWTALTITGSTLTSGATDADASDTLTLSSVQSPVGGTVAINSGNAVFTPTATAIGPASFTYTISDGHGGTSTATVNLTTTLRQINGTSGNDTLSGGSKPAQINGGAGNDTITAGSAGDILVGGAGTDTLTGGAGVDTVDYSANSVAQTINLSVTASQTISSGDVDTITNVENAIGGSGNDTITGGSGNNVLTGNAGNDALIGGSGNDTLLGGDGDDTLTGGAGNDIIDGGNGIDTVSYSANSGAQTIDLSLSTAQTISSGDVDTITNVENVIGGTGADTITGNTGNNILNGGSGADTINGNDGDDTLIGGAGNDVLNGGNGIDTVDYSANTVTQTINLALTTQQTISSGNQDTLSNIENVLGGTGADTITGTTGNNVLNGGAGNDNISGNDGDDTLIGGAGTDTLNGGNGIDTVDYSYGSVAQTINLSLTASQTISSGDADTITNVENVVGGSGNDTITGSTVANILNGGAGDDRLTGGAGDDTIIGGTGTSDVAVFAGTQASYTIATNAGVVTITDNQPSTDGNDGVDTVIGIEKAEFKGGAQVGITSPIVLDLNGDGVSLVDNRKTKVSFDWDGDGRRNQTGWIGKDDGFLFIDRDGNGTVTNGGELSFTSDKEGAKSDLDGLRAFDSNGDGIFSSADDQFAQFGVWQDKNGNGRVDSQEILTLEAAGVASINLTGEAVNRNWEWGENITVNTGSFNRTDGSVGSFSDVALSYDPSTSWNAIISRAASQLSEAMAHFGEDSGSDGFGKFEEVAERRDNFLATVRSGWR